MFFYQVILQKYFYYYCSLVWWWRWCWWTCFFSSMVVLEWGSMGSAHDLGFPGVLQRLVKSAVLFLISYHVSRCSIHVCYKRGPPRCSWSELKMHITENRWKYLGPSFCRGISSIEMQSRGLGVEGGTWERKQNDEKRVNFFLCQRHLLQTEKKIKSNVWSVLKNL